ncbi:MAG TPA: hypothetical protein VHL98_10345 [Microvirga sp.]|jgi:hypothetical protein|nr:hypothetical protein [Microvirga sp.]
MSRFLSRPLAQLRTRAATRASREREVLIRESAMVHEGVRGIRLAQSDRLPFSR